MKKRLLYDSQLLQVTISRLCQQLKEAYHDFEHTVIIGLQPRGIYLAERIKKELLKTVTKPIQLGYLDTTFHRDDFRRRSQSIVPNQTNIQFLVEEKNVILIDDVLFTGRSTRAALDAMNAYGRPKKVELLVLIDRIYCRQLPIKANYIGRKVNTVHTHRVLVELKEQGRNDNIWLVSTHE